jgi:hypothetical protein
VYKRLFKITKLGNWTFIFFIITGIIKHIGEKKLLSSWIIHFAIQLCLGVSICLDMVSIETLDLGSSKNLSQQSLDSLDYPKIWIFVEILNKTLDLDI